MKVKNVVYFILLLATFVLAMSITFYLRYKGKDVESGKSTAQESIEQNKISEKTYARLITESQNSELKEEVLNHLNNNGSYMVQDELEHNGRKYKSLYINFSEYKFSAPKFAEKYLTYTEEYKEIIDFLLKEENQIKSDEDYEVLSHLPWYPLDSFDRVSNSKTIVLERDKEYQLMENWIIAALVVYDQFGNIEDIIAYNGSVGTGLCVKNDEVIWELFYSEKVEWYLWGIKDKIHGYNTIWADGKVSGMVYDIAIDKDNTVSGVEYKRYTYDNDIFNLHRELSKEGKNELAGLKIYVKNYDLTIYDFINSKDNLCEETLGEPHTCIKGDKRLAIYFTKDGYRIFVAVNAIYDKMSKGEFYEIYFDDRAESLLDMKEIFIDGEVNPDLLKELEK